MEQQLLDKIKLLQDENEKLKNNYKIITIQENHIMKKIKRL